jgi:hypothetical protein
VFFNLSCARTHVTNCSPIHAQEPQVPLVLVFPNHDFETYAFICVLPVPPTSVFLIQRAIQYYAKGTKRGFPVHWDRRSPTHYSLVFIYRRFRTTYPSHLQGTSSPKGTERLSRNVGNYQSRLRYLPEERWLIYTAVDAWDQAECCRAFVPFSYLNSHWYKHSPKNFIVPRTNVLILRNKKYFIMNYFNYVHKKYAYRGK